MPTDSGGGEAWEALPRRLFLDSSTLQTLLNYGEWVWENVEPTAGDRAYQMAGFLDELWALRGIFRVNQRAVFDFVLSDNSLQEVTDKGDGSYVGWALDVLNHWRARIEEYRGMAFTGRGAELCLLLDGPTFGYLSAKDKLLLRDALELECDAFLTMEQKLPKNGEHLRRVLGLEVLRPSACWALLRPWAALYWQELQGLNRRSVRVNLSHRHTAYRAAVTNTTRAIDRQDTQPVWPRRASATRSPPRFKRAAS